MDDEAKREKIRRKNNRINHLTRISANQCNEDRVEIEREIEDLEQEIEELERELEGIDPDALGDSLASIEAELDKLK